MFVHGNMRVTVSQPADTWQRAFYFCWTVVTGMKQNPRENHLRFVIPWNHPKIFAAQDASVERCISSSETPSAMEKISIRCIHINSKYIHTYIDTYIYIYIYISISLSIYIYIYIMYIYIYIYIYILNKGHRWWHSWQRIILIDMMNYMNILCQYIILYIVIIWWSDDVIQFNWWHWSQETIETQIHRARLFSMEERLVPQGASELQPELRAWAAPCSGARAGLEDGRFCLPSGIQTWQRKNGPF